MTTRNSISVPEGPVRVNCPHCTTPTVIGSYVRGAAIVSRVYCRSCNHRADCSPADCDCPACLAARDAAELDRQVPAVSLLAAEQQPTYGRPYPYASDEEDELEGGAL